MLSNHAIEYYTIYLLSLHEIKYLLLCIYSDEYYIRMLDLLTAVKMKLRN